MTGGPTSSLALRIGDLAGDALIEEARLYPKPGLVDPYHSGAHDDMDHGLFLASAEALRPTFRSCAAAGVAFGGADPRELLSVLRPIGLAGEAAMLGATGGVNTHRGAIFCLGLLAAALAHLAARTREGAPPASEELGDAVCAFTGAMCAGMVDAELGGFRGAPPPGPERRPAARRGERLYRELGSRGARGEAEDGFPVLRRSILPRLRSARGLGEAAERAARLDALLGAMADLEDSCILSRGGRAALELVRREAAGILAVGGAGSAAGMGAIAALDASLCEAGLSPGGSADMLAAGIFLESLERRARP